MESLRKHLFALTVAATLGLGLIGGAVGFAQDAGREAGGEACPPASPGASPAASPIASPAASPMASPAASPTACPPTDDTTGGAMAGTEVTVQLVDIAFNPNEFTIPANTDVRVVLPNNGAAPHTFTIDELGIDSGEVPGGGTGEVTINAPAGTYEYYCRVPGHRPAGMVGTLTVQ